MTTLNAGERCIQFSLSDKVEVTKVSTTQNIYTPTLPTINCNKIDDATFLQNEINIFTHKLIKNILNKE